MTQAARLQGGRGELAAEMSIVQGGTPVSESLQGGRGELAAEIGVDGWPVGGGV